MLARKFKLTIEAVPPTSPGIKNRAEWVSENQQADLRVRQMSEAGADVALLTHKAQRLIALNGRSLHIECKNNESWTFDAKFWKSAHSAFVQKAMKQARGTRLAGYKPLLVLSKNRWEPIAVWEACDVEVTLINGPVVMTWMNLAAARLTSFIEVLDGARGLPYG